MRYRTEISSPLGQLRLFCEDDALIGLYFEDHVPAPRDESGRDDAAPFASAIEQLEEFFAGERIVFDIEFKLQGTAFQQQVWAELSSIPFGETRTYGAIASDCKRPSAVRAVGASVGRNPLSIIVPCHRVLGANGSLTGFAGGIDRKRWLLEHEKENIGMRCLQATT